MNFYGDNEMAARSINTLKLGNSRDEYKEVSHGEAYTPIET